MTLNLFGIVADHRLERFGLTVGHLLPAFLTVLLLAHRFLGL